MMYRDSSEEDKHFGGSEEASQWKRCLKDIKGPSVFL